MSTGEIWRGVSAAAVALAMLGLAGSAQEKRMPARDAVDHLLLGAPDLEEGITWVERVTGVRAARGGSHPGRGTRNALVSLGGRRYLEIIAPDPAQAASSPRTDLGSLKEPRLIAWAAASTDLDALANTARAAGQNLVGPREGSRARPDGRTLQWRTLNAPPQYAVGGVDPIPFFIEWAAGSVHPSQDSPGGCELTAFEIEHPQAAGVQKTLNALGIDVQVRESAAARLVATLQTPKGAVTLGGQSR